MRYRKLLAAVMSAVIVLSGCNADTSADNPVEASTVKEEVTITTTSEVSTTATAATTLSAATTDSADTPASDYPFKVLESGTLTVYDNGDGTYSIRHFNDDCMELEDVLDIFTYTEGGQEFVIATHLAMGPAVPADIITAFEDSGDVEILSDTRRFYDLELSRDEILYWNGGIVCRRGIGVSIGAQNVIPYYWDADTREFKPYGLHKITLDELKKLDTGNIVPDVDKAISIYRRDNGLVHVNWIEKYEGTVSEQPETASRTYVVTDNGLREYDWDNDWDYGFFLEVLTVSE